MEIKIIKFNKKIYPIESIKMAKKVYQDFFGGKFNITLKEEKAYFEVRVATQKIPENFLHEFANCVLSF